MISVRSSTDVIQVGSLVTILIISSMAKIGIFGQKPKFWAQKIGPTFGDSPCSGHDRKKLFKEKKCLCPNNQGGKCHFG